MNKLDDFLTNKIENLYLWLYDWTGIYVATICAILMIIANVVIPLNWISLTFMGLNFFVLLPYYIDQDRANFIAFNLRAMEMKCSSFRIMITWAMLFCSIFEFVTGLGIWFATGEWSFRTIFGYPINVGTVSFYLGLLTVKIREREPKEWFKKSDLAMDTL